MSLWSPSHVQFTVLRARNLIAKGKGGNNDVFVTIQLGKEKYQTSTIKNALNPEWFEECDLPIPSLQTEIEVTVFHHGVLSDDFLGYVTIPLWEYKVTETPKSSWVSLHNKPSSKSGDSKYRGELEVKLTFHSQSRSEVTPHGLKKRSSSIRNLATVFGDKFKFARSRSFRENRRDPEGGKVDKSRTLGGTGSRDGQETPGGISPYAHSSVHFSALDINRAPWGIDPSAPDTLTRSYSMSAAYIKSMSLDRNKQDIYSVSKNTTSTDETKSKKNGSTNVTHNIIPQTGVSQVYSQSMHNLPGNRRSCTEIPLRQPPPLPYDPRLSSKDDLVLKDMNDRRAMSEYHINSAFRVPPVSNYFDSAPRTELSGIYESIRERTEPENSVSSSSDPESVPMPRPRHRRLPRKDGAPALRRNKGDPHEFNGRDSGILEDRSSSHGNSLEGSSITTTDGTINNGSKPRGRAVTNDNESSHLELTRSETQGNNPSVFQQLERGRTKKKVPVPSLFYSKENNQGELVVRKRSRGQRDRLRQIRQGNKRYTVQGLDNHSGLYDESLSDTSDASRPEVPDDLLSVLKNMTKEELFRVVIQSKAQMIRKDQYIKDLENYIDDLLVRVMEAKPKLLSRPGMHR
ncbi:unnamed protein product [Lymnaea stagnalis]|uniref:Uncharacterized protein n=1 Tax=Lymnaea stagnalis TaxID=6523 RepID=A0AAV2ICW6_LYMST